MCMLTRRAGLRIVLSMRVLLPTLALALLSCGGSTPPPEDPSGQDSSDLDLLPPDVPDEVYAPTDSWDQGSKKPQQTEAEAEEKQEEPEPVVQADTTAETGPPRSQAPDRVLTTSGVVFVLDYDASDLKKSIEAKCARATEDEEDEEKHAGCLKKEREAFQADVLRFKQFDADELSWVIYKQQGDNLNEVYSADFEFKDQTATSVTVVVKGGGMGKRPIMRGKQEVPIEVPNTYSMVIQDPEYGRLPYNARYGLGGN